MLNDQEQQKIRDEEFFRNEVRKSLETKPDNSFLLNFWKFLNSSFGLWVISTVIVGFITLRYSKYQQNLAADKKRLEIERKLNIEILNRVDNFYYVINELRNSYKFVKAPVREERIDSAILLLDGVYSRDKYTLSKYIFPEYKVRPFESLMYELEQTVKEVKDKDSIHTARKLIRNLKYKLRKLPPPILVEENHLIFREEGLFGKYSREITVHKPINGQYENKRVLVDTAEYWILKDRSLKANTLNDVLWNIQKDKYLSKLLKDVLKEVKPEKLKS